MKLILASGRTLSLAELHQHRTYAGLLAGKPGARLNRALIDDLMDQARTYGVGSRPRLIAPTTQVMAARLPRVACVAVLESDPLLRSDEPYSSLTVVWFQDEFAPPLSPSIIDYVRAVDWEASAHAWCP